MTKTNLLHILQCERQQSIDCNNPWGYGCSKILCRKGSQWYILPFLHISCYRDELTMVTYSETLKYSGVNRADLNCFSKRFFGKPFTICCSLICLT